jgi:hypothetical protein
MSARTKSAAIVKTGPPTQTKIAQWCGTPEKQSTHQMKADIHIYPTQIPSIIFRPTLYLQRNIKKPQVFRFFWDTLNSINLAPDKQPNLF